MVIKAERAIQKNIIHWFHCDYPSEMIVPTDNENNYKDTASIGEIGITDLILFHLRNEIVYVLFLELKTTEGKLKPSQIKWNEKFDLIYKNAVNARREVAYGFLEAKEIITAWLGGQYDGTERASE